jgi:hypothetical protein
MTPHKLRREAYGETTEEKRKAPTAGKEKPR